MPAAQRHIRPVKTTASSEQFCQKEERQAVSKPTGAQSSLLSWEDDKVWQLGLNPSPTGLLLAKPTISHRGINL